MRSWFKRFALLLLVVIIPDRNHGNVLAKGGNAFYAEIAGFFLAHLP